MKILATFISGIKCIKGLDRKSPNRTLPQEAIVIDFGLDLAATESNRQPTNRKQACKPREKIFKHENQPSPRTCRDLQANGPAAISWPFITRTYQKLETLTSDFYNLSVPNFEVNNAV